MSPPDPSQRGNIGPYRIVMRVGAGGMGEVFKAWDPRLERDVAIKVLHPSSALDPERQRRLLAEGRAASALNHPNILRVYDVDVDADGGSYYLVSEWLEGKSLRDELSRGPLPLKRLLELSVQIADGLAAAHAIGVVHRDIKPENIMLARDGTARIVDFGLARSEPSAASLSIAADHATTVSLEGGLSGTPAYMSPEQARGNAGDFRTDQFSFGALLYEMATGTFAFRRDSVADTLSAVLHEEPKPIAELNPRIPAALRWIAEQCLAKDANERYSATDDLARELRRVRDRLLEALADPKAMEVGTTTSRGRRIAIAVGVAALTGVAFAAGLLLRSPDTPELTFVPFATASAYEGAPAWSADSQTLAYVADVDGVLQVFVKRLRDAVSRQLTQGRFDSQQPFFSPNGQLVYFTALAGDREALWSVSVAGGRPELVLENVVRAAIDPEGKRMAILRNHPTFNNRRSLWWSSPPGSEPVREERPPFNEIQSTSNELAFSRDGKLLVWMYAVSVLTPATSPAASGFYLLPPDAGQPRTVLTRATQLGNLQWFSWLPDSRHVVLALPDLRVGNRHIWLADIDSDDLRRITTTHTNETDPEVSPDGQRIAYASDEVDFDLVLITPDGQARRPMLATARNELAPVWSPTGDQYAYVTDRSGSLEIWARSRDGQFERPIVTAADFSAPETQTLGSLAFSPNGRTLAYQRSDGRGFEIWLSPAMGGTPVRLVSPSTDVLTFQDSPAWSPDGEWVAYLYTTRAGTRLGKVRVGTQESVMLVENMPLRQIQWSPDGRWLFSQGTDGLVRLPADGGTPELLLADTLLAYTLSADGRRLYGLMESESLGHFALVEIDAATGAVKTLNPDLGSIPVANEPIRGFSFLRGQGFLTSLASARSDIWLLEGFQPPGGWLSQLLRRGR